MGSPDIATVVERIAAFATDWGLGAFGAIAVFALGRWVAGRVRRALRKGLSRSRMEPTLVPFTASGAYWAVMAFVMISVLALFGVPTASLVAVIGAVGEYSVDFAVQPWCERDDYVDLKRELPRRIEIEFGAAGCRIPFPQRDVHLHQVA